MERYFGGALCYGPDIEDGFYYDMWMGKNTISSEGDMPKLEKLYNQMMKEKQPFQVQPTLKVTFSRPIFREIFYDILHYM